MNIEEKASAAMGSARVYLHFGNALDLMPKFEKLVERARGAIYQSKSSGEFKIESPDSVTTDFYTRLEASLIEGYESIRTNSRKGIGVEVKEDDLRFKIAQSLSNAIPNYSTDGTTLTGLDDILAILDSREAGKKLGGEKSRYVKPRDRGKVPIRKF